MRWAKSYSIVDHQLLHRGFFRRLSVQALALYLFLVVVSDQEGRSYYAEKTVMDILRLSGHGFTKALNELCTSGLIFYRRPYFWVTTISERKDESSIQGTF